MSPEERAAGCLIGSAYGDSLGAAVEFDTIDEIRQQYGQNGITKLVSVYGRRGNITDDTQMALATAEGLIETPDEASFQATISSLWQSYVKWYETQSDFEQVRAPGSTCLSALSSGRMGTLERPLNESAGCGAVMRAHPIGIAVKNRSRAFELGMASGAVTHGHPNGYVPAGFLSVLVSELMDGADLQKALGYTTSEIKRLPSGLETVSAVRKAFQARDITDTARTIDREIGGTGGWVGHDALGISVFASLQAPEDPLEAIRIAVNHSGDSDSTGAITGAIMGSMHGPEVFQSTLCEQGVELEHRDRLGYLAAKLAEMRSQQA